MTYDLIVVGAGAVGLATAYQALAERPGLALAVVDKETAVAVHQTGRNSGVIHSGIYYAPGSLKAATCRAGYRLLLAFARDEGIPHEVCGKLIVATRPEELPRLAAIGERGRANGLEGLRDLGPEEIREREPHAAGLRAILVPQTGIIDFGTVCRRLEARLRAQGVEFFFGQRVESIRRRTDGFELAAAGRSLTGRRLAVCAGLQSDRLARLTRPDFPYRIVPFRGEYYELRPERADLVRHLIYPVPDPAFPFLGVHFTRRVDGRREAGPNAVLALAREGYRRRDVSLADTFETLAWPGFRRVARRYWRTGLAEIYRSFSKPAFVRALQRLVPELRADDLAPGGAGVRAQAASRDGGLADDFVLIEEAELVQVVNAPSPAATAALAIGQAVARKVLGTTRP